MRDLSSSFRQSVIFEMSPLEDFRERLKTKKIDDDENEITLELRIFKSLRLFCGVADVRELSCQCL